MAKDTFQLDITSAGMEILEGMAADVVEQSAVAIMQRAESMAASQSTEAPGFNLYHSIGTIKRGKRAISTIKANETGNAHANYIAHGALVKAIDAGRV